MIASSPKSAITAASFQRHCFAATSDTFIVSITITPVTAMP